MEDFFETDICMNRLNKGEVALNGPRMAATDATDPESVTNAELLGQKQAQDFLDITLRGYVPGFENAFISHINDGILTMDGISPVIPE